jgi:hypothetical protein
VIAVASRAGDGRRTLSARDERDLELVGFLTFVDRPKADAHEGLDRLTRLDVEVGVVCAFAGDAIGSVRARQPESSNSVAAAEAGGLDLGAGCRAGRGVGIATGRGDGRGDGAGTTGGDAGAAERVTRTGGGAATGTTRAGRWDRRAARVR